MNSPNPTHDRITGYQPGERFDRTLTHQDVFAFLPFQTNARRLVIPIYVMTYDITQRMPEETYQLTIKGLDAEAKSVRLDRSRRGGAWALAGLKRAEEIQPASVYGVLS